MVVRDLICLIPRDNDVKVMKKDEVLFHGKIINLDSKYYNLRVVELDGYSWRANHVTVISVQNNPEKTIDEQNEILEKYILDRKDCFDRNVKIEYLGLSNRSYHCLLRGGCRTIGDILDRIPEKCDEWGNPLRRNADECSVKYIRNLGRLSYNDILNKLAECIDLVLFVSKSDRIAKM